MEYQHFTIQEVSEGVYAAIHKEGGGAFSNAGIINLGDRTLVFDSFETLSAGKELGEAVHRLTGRPPSWLIISHKHADHWAGNQVFIKDAVIISTHHTRQGMMEWGKELEMRKEKPWELEEEIQSLQDGLARESDPVLKATLERRLIRNRYLKKDLPEFQFCPPQQTFDGIITIHGSRRMINIVTTGPAHTQQECYLHLPDEKILFTGDLAFFNSPPFIAPDHDFEGWLNQLEAFESSDVTLFVPGHGATGGKSELEMQKRYLEMIHEMVEGKIGAGMSLGEIESLPMPEEFQEWKLFNSRHQNNLRTLFATMGEKKK